MAELADALVLETSPERGGGSNPSWGIKAMWRNLADARVSRTRIRKGVWVRVPAWPVKVREVR